MVVDSKWYEVLVALSLDPCGLYLSRQVGAERSRPFILIGLPQSSSRSCPRGPPLEDALRPCIDVLHVAHFIGRLVKGELRSCAFSVFEVAPSSVKSIPMHQGPGLKAVRPIIKVLCHLRDLERAAMHVATRLSQRCAFEYSLLNTLFFLSIMNEYIDGTLVRSSYKSSLVVHNLTSVNMYCHSWRGTPDMTSRIS